MNLPPSLPPLPSSGDAADPMIGRVIADRFRIVSLMAKGGMGRVYRAEQLPLGRICALKVVHPGFAAVDPEFQKRFMLEASTVSRLTHPNTVTIFDYGKTDDDVYYMAMELLEGVTLHRAIRDAWAQGGFDQERAFHIAAQVCRSLREAHGQGVIHRDLKPANIILVSHGDERDFVKVLDFGLVKQVADRPEEQLTQTGLFMGSPKYVAPEQIEGQRVDGRTDIYALGIILYEMLTGRVPFEKGTNVATLMAHVHDTPPALKVANGSVLYSMELEALMRSCLGKQPEERFSSMDALLEALRTVSSSPSLAATSIRQLSAPVLAAMIAGGPAPATGVPPVAHSQSGSSPPSGRPPRSFAGAAGQTLETQIERLGGVSMRPATRAGGPSWLTVVSLLLFSAFFGGAAGYAAFRAVYPGAVAVPHR
jgi:eukaryotic-like serine/threonine-protein kinase